MKVAKVKTEIEVLKKKLERYNAQKEAALVTSHVCHQEE